MNLLDYDYIVLNSSAGKDSQTMLRRVWRMANAQGYPLERMVVAHAELGQMEWPGTRELAEYQARSYGLKFWVKARPQGDLLTHIEQRGMFPSNGQRYCTSEHKRGQISTLLTSLGSGIKVLNCMGMRAQESPARAKLRTFEVNQRSTNSKRHIDQWLPIHDMTLGEVWDDIHASPIPYHYAYDLGMPRLSCVFCIFSPREDLKLAGLHNPLLLARYVAVEQRIRHTFRADQSLAEVQSAIATAKEKL